MKMVVIAVVALLVIGGGGAGAYFYMMPQDGEEVVAVAEATPTEPLGPPAFVELDPFMLSVVGKNKAHYNLGMAVVIQVKSETDVEYVENLKPKFVHYFLEELYESMGNEVDKDQSHSQSLAEVQDKLIKIAQEIAGKERVDDVLIQLMSKQPV